jgi:NAD(P)-dependent dehydrogenase (short-subunit alcohol dehydrogenase family)
MVRDKVVLITGAARGIGRYVAKTFAAEGAKLAISDVLPLDDTTAELRAMNTEPLAVAADVRDEEGVRAMMARIAAHFGRIDVLINNAGIPTHVFTEKPRIRDMDRAFWDRIMDTNLGGVFLCTKHVIPYMEHQGGGHIVNVYGGGTLGTPGTCVYLTSKDAVRTLTRFVAEEEREHNICVVAITPGGQIATEVDSEEVKRQVPGVEAVGDRYVQVAQVGMEHSGKLFTIRDGALAVVG